MSVQRDPSWERHCADLAIERVNEATGRDVWAELGGKPANNREAADLYRRNGARCLADLVTKVLGPPVDPKLAMRGDLCMVEFVDAREVPQGRDGGLGICRGEWVECFDRMRPLRLATAAWKVTGKPRRRELLDCEQSAR